MTPPVASTHVVLWLQTAATRALRSIARLNAWRPARPSSTPANGPDFKLKPTQNVVPNGTSASWLLSFGSDV